MSSYLLDNPKSTTNATTGVTPDESVNESVNKSVVDFWAQLIKFWPQLYELICKDANSRTHALQLINGLLSEEDFKRIQIEMTLGEVNRIPYAKASKLVELYISPRLLKNNVPLMEQFYKAKPSSSQLPNLEVYKYRAYNPSDALIKDIVYPATEDMKEYTANYTDLGYQSSTTYDSLTKQPLLNLVIYVRKSLADIILKKKKVTFTSPPSDTDEKKDPIVMEKWLPENSTVVDVFLLNAIGEYNLVNNIGYIEFLPDGDPLIANGSVFCELADLRGDIKLLESSLKVPLINCKTCNRNVHQGTLFSCSRCKKATYCCVICQKIDYGKHKLRCK